MKKRPLEATVMSLIWCAVGLLYMAGPLWWQDQRFLEMVLWVTAGMLLLLAGISLWRMESWGALCFGLFIGLRLIVRFSDDVLNGTLITGLGYVVYSAVFLGIGIGTWKYVD